MDPNSLVLLVILTPVGMLLWVGMQWFPLWLLGINLKEALDDITLPEAVFFGSYSIGSAHLVSSLLSRFV